MTQAVSDHGAGVEPGGIPPKADPERVQQLLQSGRAVLVDVREPIEHAREHIAGSKLVPLGKLTPEAVGPCDGRVVVLHCASGNRSAAGANRLRSACDLEVVELEGGLTAWKQAGLATVFNPKTPISIMRQVQIAAGSLIVIGTILGAVVSPWFLLLSGFVGAGLVFAGVSGTCGMASLLGVMPWNRVPQS